MKDFHRDNPLFSLCGLNCGLCQMYVGHYCPGCGGGDGNQSCALARCSRTHGDVAYCFQCAEYPCAQYDGFGEYDSILPCRNRRQDIERAAEIGIPAYTAELREKMALLDRLLACYNDGRRKTFFLTAVYLLELPVLQGVMAVLPAEDIPLKDRAAAAVRLLERAAAERGVTLKLRKKPKMPSRDGGTEKP